MLSGDVSKIEFRSSGKTDGRNGAYSGGGKAGGLLYRYGGSKRDSSDSHCTVSNLF